MTLVEELNTWLYKALAVLLVVVLSLHPCALRAQTTNASITGRVMDPSKASVPDAKIAALNSSTSFRYETVTNGAGEYTLANLPPGTYQIEVEKSGFKKLVRPDVILHVQDALVIDFEMAVGSASDTITVQAGAPLVHTTSATVSTVVDQTFVEDMLLNGRSFQTLIMLTPGAVVTQTAFDDQEQFSVNGQRADANYFTVDGVSANFGVTGFPALAQVAGGALPTLTALGGTNSLVSVDALQEFRVQTSSFAPEYGRAHPAARFRLSHAQALISSTAPSNTFATACWTRTTGFRIAPEGKNFASQPFAVTQVYNPATMALAPSAVFEETRIGGGITPERDGTTRCRSGCAVSASADVPSLRDWHRFCVSWSRHCPCRLTDRAVLTDSG